MKFIDAGMTTTRGKV